jgi:hypothetical protein
MVETQYSPESRDPACLAAHRHPLRLRRLRFSFFDQLFKEHHNSKYPVSQLADRDNDKVSPGGAG